MNHSSSAAVGSRKRAAALLVGAALSFGTPLVVAGTAAADNAAGTTVSATFGDCKNDNAGQHDGYVCPVPVTSTASSTDTGASAAVIYVS